MFSMRAHCALFPVALSTMTLACEEPGDVKSLQTALAEAHAGDVISAPVAVYEGDFTVPAGVSLRPDGVGTIEIVGAECVPTLRVVTAAGAGKTLVSGVEVRSECGAAVVVRRRPP